MQSQRKTSASSTGHGVDPNGQLSYFFIGVHGKFFMKFNSLSDAYMAKSQLYLWPMQTFTTYRLLCSNVMDIMGCFCCRLAVRWLDCSYFLHRHILRKFIVRAIYLIRYSMPELRNVAPVFGTPSRNMMVSSNSSA